MTQRQQRILVRVIGAIALSYLLWQIAVSLIAPTVMAQESPTQSQPTAAPTRRYRIEEAWQKVYQQVPDLPRENQYVNRETGKVDPNNTLISRLIRYHYYVKGRPVNYRLDWKFTLADYLGINEPIEASSYPGASNLRQNPFERDRAIIQKLNRKQRDALVQALVNVFTNQ